jgi:hypothetical protein
MSKIHQNRADCVRNLNVLNLRFHIYRKLGHPQLLLGWFIAVKGQI